MSIVSFITGIPGSGKTEAGRTFTQVWNDEGLRTMFINDYPVLTQWARKNRGNEHLVTWAERPDGSESFNIQLPAYRQASLWVVRQLAAEARQVFVQGWADIVAIESARGAGEEGMRDRYADELFIPFMSIVGGLAQYVNAEIIVRELETVMGRMDRRSQTDPMSAPAFVAKKYVSPNEGRQSAHAAALATGLHASSEIQNNGSLEEYRGNLAVFAGQVVQLLARV